MSYKSLHQKYIEPILGRWAGYPFPDREYTWTNVHKNGPLIGPVYTHHLAKMGIGSLATAFLVPLVDPELAAFLSLVWMFSIKVASYGLNQRWNWIDWLCDLTLHMTIPIAILHPRLLIPMAIIYLVTKPFATP